MWTYCSRTIKRTWSTCRVLVLFHGLHFQTVVQRLNEKHMRKFTQGKTVVTTVTCFSFSLMWIPRLWTHITFNFSSFLPFHFLLSSLFYLLQFTTATHHFSFDFFFLSFSLSPKKYFVIWLTLLPLFVFHIFSGFHVRSYVMHSG